MIITCPGCYRQFRLEKKAPQTFHCPKCELTVPFSVILNEQKRATHPNNKTKDGTITPQPAADKTKVVEGLVGGAKTSVVPSLQQRSKATLHITFQGRQYGAIPLPLGCYDLGRNSSDSKARIKLTPDMSMSRIHAGMRTTKINGQLTYQITSVRNENPVYVNNKPIPKGAACNLRNGDKLRMGNTSLTFRTN